MGASAQASAPTGAPTLNVTTTAPGSLIFATGHDWDSATARTLGAGQTLIHEVSDTSTLDDSWVQRTTNPVPVGPEHERELARWCTDRPRGA